MGTYLTILNFLKERHRCISKVEERPNFIKEVLQFLKMMAFEISLQEDLIKLYSIIILSKYFLKEELNCVVRTLNERFTDFHNFRRCLIYLSLLLFACQYQLNIVNLIFFKEILIFLTVHICSRIDLFHYVLLEQLRILPVNVLNYSLAISYYLALL